MDCMLGDVFIAKDTLIVIPVYAIHRDADNFDQPDVFCPERFLSKSSKHANPYSFIPFATGPRGCLGMRFALFEMKLGLVSILQRFRFSVCNETNLTSEFTDSESVYSPSSLILNVIKR